MAGSALAFVFEAVAGETIATAASFALVDAGVALGYEYVAGTIISSAVGLVANGVVGGLLSSGGGGGGGSDGGGGVASVSAARAQGVLLNVSSNVAPIPVLYGTRKIGGSRVLCETSGASNEFLHIVVALCEGEIGGITSIYLDDVDIYDSRFAGTVVDLQLRYGPDDQVANPNLMARLPSKITDTFKGAGVAYIYVCLQYSQSAYSGLPTITALTQGKKVFDPRTGLSAWSDNPALCIRDYLTNSRYGRGIASALIDDTAIISAANYCDELVAVPGGTQKRYTCNGVLDVNNTCLANIKSLLTSCRGFLVFSAGTYRLVLDRVTTPSFTFSEDNIVGDWTITQPGRRSKFNRVTANIFNSQLNWQPDYAITDSTAYRAIDNGLLLEAKIDAPFTDGIYRGQQLAGLHLKQSRFGIAVRFKALQEGLRAEVADVVYITHTTPGWVAKPFRVTQIDITSEDEVEVTCIEYDDSVYNLDALTAITGVATTTLPDVFTVAAPANLLLTSGTSELLRQSDGTVVSRIKAVWPAPLNTFVVNTEVQYKLSSATIWQSAPSALPSDGVLWIAPVLDGGTYNVRVRFENVIGVKSAWTNGADHTVVGKTQAPTAPATVSLTQSLVFFSKVTDVDLDGYIIRSQPGTTGIFSRGTALHDGLVTVSPFTLTQRLYGVQTIMVAAVDTTGNISAATSATLDFGQPDTGNFVQTADYRALGFPGTLSSCSVSSGDLVADALVASDDYALADAYGEPDLYATQYAAMQWVSQSFVPVYGGGTVSLAYTAAGPSVTVEYRIDGDTITNLYSSSDEYVSADLYGAPSAYQTWPGALAVSRMQGIQWRVSIASSAEQGKLTAFVPSLAAQELAQTFANQAINSGGTRLVPANGTPARNWISLRSVQITPYVDGSGAIAGRLLDFSPALGPLAQLVDNTGTAVSGTATIELRGLADV